MVARGHGRMLNVASIAAFQPVPSLATYAATKAYVLSLTESLAEELRGSGVTVTALCPGITATAMLSAAVEPTPRSRLPGFLIGDVDGRGRRGLPGVHGRRGDPVPGASTGHLAGAQRRSGCCGASSGALGRKVI